MQSNTPKVLHRLAGRTIISHVLHAVSTLRADRLIVVLGYERHQILPEVEQVAAELGIDLWITVQEQQRGTGHAVSCGLTALPDDFHGRVVVTPGDTPLLAPETFTALMDCPTNTVVTTTLNDPTGYGRVLRMPDADLIGIVEHSDANTHQLTIREVNAGIYSFAHDGLHTSLMRLRADNAQRELYLPDVVGLLREDGHNVHTLQVEPDVVAGVNDRAQLAEAARILNRRIVTAHQLAGVTITDPATTWIDLDVKIGRDTIIHPNTHIHGDTRIGAGCEIGPFAYVRPGTHLGDGSKVGAFVEVKNSTIGTGTKIPHLTYVGDADIGDHTNIGAGTVVANYDGQTKHRTTIGSNVKGGADTTYVAPVTVGDNAYTGAGTVVREDIPPAHLAVSAGKQRNIEKRKTC